MVMSFLTQQDKQRIRAAITEAELHTSGEIVTVIASRSDTYLYIPTLWAALIALCVPGINFLLNTPLDAVLIYQLQVAIFLILALLFRWDALTMHLIPKTVKQARAARFAREQFISHALHSTKNRAAILIFVSVAEHYVEIIGDKGINDKVEHDVWQSTLTDFTSLVKQGQTAEGFISAINHSRILLQKHFPSDGANKNELPNHLIEI
jgi:putative membrane protein